MKTRNEFIAEKTENIQHCTEQADKALVHCILIGINPISNFTDYSTASLPCRIDYSVANADKLDIIITQLTKQIEAMQEYKQALCDLSDEKRMLENIDSYELAV